MAADLEMIEAGIAALSEELEMLKEIVLPMLIEIKELLVLEEV